MSDPLADFATETVRSVGEIEAFAHVGHIYRGHHRSCWLLETTLERCCTRHDVPKAKWFMVEGELLREFRRAYYRYASHVPDESAIIEWLSLMQHYGAPTRLLDFTYSLHIATYFAVEKARGDSAVWLLNPEWALETATARFRTAGKPEDVLKEFQAVTTERSEIALGSLFRAEPPHAVPLVCGVNAFRLNERLQIQKGVFVAPGDVTASFMDNLREMPGYADPKNVLRMTIPAAAAKKIRADLFGMNITRRSLFPGLDGYAQALGIYHPVFDPNDPLRKRLEKQ
jgi:hypothetical protein